MIAASDKDDRLEVIMGVVLEAGGNREPEADVGEGEEARGDKGCVCTGGNERPEAPPERGGGRYESRGLRGGWAGGLLRCVMGGWSPR